jgi:hypothetical protein
VLPFVQPPPAAATSALDALAASPDTSFAALRKSILQHAHR